MNCTAVPITSFLAYSGTPYYPITLALITKAPLQKSTSVSQAERKAHSFCVCVGPPLTVLFFGSSVRAFSVHPPAHISATRVLQRTLFFVTPALPETASQPKVTFGGLGSQSRYADVSVALGGIDRS